MKFSVKITQPEKMIESCLIVAVFEDGKLSPAAKAIDQANQGCLKQLYKQGALRGKTGEILPLFSLINPPHKQILLLGCGKSGKLSPSQFHKVLKSAMKALQTAPASEAVCYLTELEVEGQAMPWKVKQIVEVCADSRYRFDHFMSQKNPASSLKELVIHIDNKKDMAKCETALRQASAIAEGINLTKNLANTPSNICTPTFLAEQAKELAKSYPSLSVKILDEKDMEKLKMGALLAVSQGSAEEARLICFEYKGADKSQAPVVLVGKGITFDTGGNSLKPADSMVGMKYDMCGAASVFGTVKAAAELKLPVNVVGIIAAVENMPGGMAYKPEDILTSMSGQTIEVISTDAEGRLVLADALTYCERYKPAAVIDIATLTGAVVIALGVHTTGLVANDDKLAKALLKAGEQSHDRVWQLPMWEEYDEQLKSPFADMANVGGRAAGTITAGCFLSRFAKKFDWAHLDVAGTAANMMGTTDRAATGRPVPMLVQYLINQAT